MNTIRILIVDDHVVVRQGLAAMLTSRNGMELVGEATNGREAMRLEPELAPDVVIMDLQMPADGWHRGNHGHQETKSKGAHPRFDQFQRRRSRFSNYDAGAAGYLLKDSGADELLQAIRSIHSGHLVMSPKSCGPYPTTPQRGQASSPAVELTPRELEVLQGIVDGLTNQGIAVKLGISSHHRAFTCQCILSKLGVTNRTQAALIAQEQHLL